MRRLYKVFIILSAAAILVTMVFMLTVDSFADPLSKTVIMTQLPCKDVYPNCTRWAEDGWCIRADGYMSTHCRLSCKLCSAAVRDVSVNGYVVYTPTCRILDVDPWHASIKKYVRRDEAPLKCMNYKKLANLENGTLWMDSEFSSMNATCFYEPVTRTFVDKNDNNWKYGARVNFLSSSKLGVADDFVHVICEKSGSVVYDDFLTQAHISLFKTHKDEMNMLPPTNAKYKHRKVDEKLNILMIGIDSMSRLNGRRHLTKLRDYILKDLKGIELNGYNRVGDNTFLNICPLTMGKTIDELKWDASKHLDDQPFIWKRFMAKGYASLYAEDSTEGSIFNYLKKGFSKCPSHHYYRPMSLALEKSKLYKKSPRWCCGRKGLHRWTLDYMKQLATTYHAANIPYFGFVFNTYISHDDINAVGKTDGEYTDFLRWANETILNNTVVIVFGDHGYRFGGIRSTYVGRYEENLPMIMMAFPPWFGRKYPAYMKALRSNQKALTTPFDVHVTLRDLCKDCEFDKPSDYGTSLFDHIPYDRKCAAAGIPMHYCACREEKKVDIKDRNVVDAGNALLGRVNQLSEKKKDLCVVQNLSEIIDASTTVHDQTFSKGCTVKGVCYDSNWHKLETTFTLYLVTIQTHPGVAQYQATVRKEAGKFEVMGDISRINLYGNTSSCITDDFNLRKFCYCKSNLS